MVPTGRPQENPYRVGDVVVMPHKNGAGEGVLWRVVKVKKAWIMIETFWTVTGPSALRTRWVQHGAVTDIDVVELAVLYAQLGNIIADVAKSRGMVVQ